MIIVGVITVLDYLIKVYLKHLARAYSVVLVTIRVFTFDFKLVMAVKHLDLVVKDSSCYFK